MPDENQIRQMVRRIVYRTLGLPQGSRPVAARPLVTEADVQAVSAGGQLDVPQGALVTPLARQVALERRVTLSHTPALAYSHTSMPAPSSDQKTIAIGADHGGYELKEMLKGYLGELGHRIIDCGTDSAESVDYADFAFAVAQLVAQRRAWRGIIVDGAGIGSCMAANKVPGARAAMCYDQATASNSR